MVLQYQPYTDTFSTYPYHHSISPSFEAEFVDLMFDSIVFYAYEKEEIEKEFNRGRFSVLRTAARNAYERRVQKLNERRMDYWVSLRWIALLNAFLIISKCYIPV